MVPTRPPNGSLFTQYYLDEGIRLTPEYAALDPSHLQAAQATLKTRWSSFTRLRDPSEAQTEHDWIFPTLQQLGWEWLAQPKTDRSRRDIPDALLFRNAEAKRAAQPLPAERRFHHGSLIVENEAVGTLLDKAHGAAEAPATQILRYMSRADVQSRGVMRWGLLTNGRQWRLYDHRATSRAEGFVEIDLADLLDPLPLAPTPVPPGAPPDHWLRVFLLLFRPAAFAAEGPGATTFLEAALEGGRTYQARITEALSAQIFDQVFPATLRALLRHDPAADIHAPSWRAAAQEAAIRLLYRLLFLLYAEDRNLLPVASEAYKAYSLRRLRDEAAGLLDQATPLSGAATRRWAQLLDVFRAIADGDTALGLPAYNGSLFRDPPGDILARARLPDTVLVPLIDAMSRQGTANGVAGQDRRFINYRDLSVQHLGSIYERLLEQTMSPDGTGGLRILPSPYARKGSGSYYTREELVALILRQTVQPLIDERLQAFRDALDTSGPAPPGFAPDPAEAILRLRICDPAMGSGHFLVSLVDLLTDAVLAALAEAADAGHPSPVAARITAIRARIEANAQQQGWTIPPGQLDDRHIVRRMVLKRCVFGVDLNPMATELAKLSLWLHSFTVGAPLSFLDHHLRTGDSLFGEFVGEAIAQLRQEHGLAVPGIVAAAEAAAATMAGLEDLSDADIDEVRESYRAFKETERDTAPLRAFLDLYHAARWLPAAGPADRLARQALFTSRFGDPAAIMAGAPLTQPETKGEKGSVALRPARAARKLAPSAPGPALILLVNPPYISPTTKPLSPGKPPVKPKDAITAEQVFAAAQSFVAQARALVAEARFLHWQAAFPGVWTNWQSASPEGGFDAVIGNPPWDRIKMQEVEWWAAREPAVARLSRASDRKRAIAARRAANDPLANDYDRAAARAKRAAEVAAQLPALRKDGTPRPGPYPLYPLFAKGDVNLYALFVERAGQLAAPGGVVGLLVPSGVAADKGAATFFRSISSTGRLRALLDFENGRRRGEPFFPEVHRSFKFAALVHGGTARRYTEARCAFFQASAAAAEANSFPMSAADFARVNPNTGTAPVFRSEADAAIVLGIYSRCPVLLDRRTNPPRALYPVTYARQFDMTNDSHLFRTAEELEADSAYPVRGGRYQKGNTSYLPLMSGRSIHLFDHRYASVLEEDAEELAADAGEDEEARLPTVSRNVNRPFSTGETTPEQHADPGYIPTPRHWVAEPETVQRWPEGLEWALAFRDITSATNVRTAICAIVPRAAFANALPLLLPSDAAAYRAQAALLAGNLGSLALDYLARTKAQSVHLSAYILEQLPLIPPEAYARRFGPRTAEAIVREEVLHLTYTAHDLEPFARDQGCDGPPFPWDEEDRLRRRARLDAVFMLLYGLTRAQAAYILDTFPIVKREEETRHGRFRTRDLILRWMAALEAGDPDASITG